MVLTEKSLLEALNQNWQHIRHIENERLQFTYLYVVLTVGILAFLEKFSLSNYFYLIIFLVIFSVFGLIFTLKVNIAFDNYMEGIKNIISILQLESYMGYPNYKGIGKIISLRYIFILFYTLMLLIWLFLLKKSINS